MTYAEFEAQLKTLGLPVAYACFDEEQDPTTDYICYITDDETILYADNSVKLTKDVIRIELYTRQKNSAQESAMETLLSSNHLNWRKDPDEWLENEAVFMICYYTTIN